MDTIYQFAGWGTYALEVALGVILVVHGWSKLRNPVATGRVLGKGKNAGLVFGVVEVLAGFMIATGLGTRFGTGAVIVIMVGAIYFKTAKWKMPFKTDSTGWEFDLLILAGALALLLG